MSLSDYFKKNSVLSISNNSSLSELGEEVESFELVEQHVKLLNKTVSVVDWLEPSEFVRYGSAEKYYEDAIKNIYLTYPYDGSYKEKIEWELSSSQLSKFIFDNYYPRYNGYANIGSDYGSFSANSDGYNNTDKVEYIHFNGTLNTSQTAKNSKEHYSESNILDSSNNREFNLKLDGTDGATVEFYLKKENLLGSPKQVIFDLWNSASIGDASYGRFRIELHPGIVGEEDKFFIEISSGSNGISNTSIGDSLDFISSWNHYAISFINKNSSLELTLMVNGEIKEKKTIGTPIGFVGLAVQAQIGSLLTTVPGTTTSRGWGKLSASIDEFRYWKKRRTDKDISRYYFTNIGAGVNSDNSNTTLGVYFKFNEGIYSTSSISKYDQIVLDYSGRISNGNWVGYNLNSRSTDSAIVLSKAAEKEYEDPVIYPKHPEILEVLNYFKELGREYDLRNDSSIFNTIPSWIKEQDYENGEGIRDLTQIMAEFFDELHLKIKAIPQIKNNSYHVEQELSFTKQLLDSIGFKSFEIFSDSTLLEEFLSRNEEENYEEKLFKIRNEVYKNIYNNLIKIYRSKGTNKSFRNLLHCFGVDENLIKLNLYSNDLEYVFEDRYLYTLLQKKSVNFNDTDRFIGTIYQKQDSTNPNSLGYLPGNVGLKKYGSSIETSIIFPKKFNTSDYFYFDTPFLTSSLFGIHESDDGVWQVGDNASIQVFAIKDKIDSKSARFMVSSSHFSTVMTSSLYDEVYENEKWNLCLSIRSKKEQGYDYEGSEDTDYILELYGVSSVQDIKQRSFLLTSSVSSVLAEQYFSSNKMVYAGAHRQDYSGSVLQSTDIKLLSLKYWNNYINNDIIDLHSKDETNFGVQSTYSYKYNNVSEVDTLALRWEFDSITSSDNGNFPLGSPNDNDGKFYIQDLSSGSLELLATDSISQYTKYQFTGVGDFFLRNDPGVVNLEYLPNAKRSLPESLTSDNLTNILERDDEIFTKQSVPVNHYFAIEKSMFQIISQEMINFVGSLKDFSNLIGNPIYRYEDEYRNLQFLKQRFFMNVENEPDFNEFLEFYKWIDEAIYNSVLQIVPVSLNMVENVFNVYESHVLERNKYKHKLPTLELKGKIGVAATNNISAPTNKWFAGCRSKNKLALENIDNRNILTKKIFDEINRKEYIEYSFKMDYSDILYDKKRTRQIIRNEIGFDFSGTDSLQIDINLDNVCKCEE